MKHEIKPTQDHVDIEVADLGGQKGEALASFEACAAGRCACPTDEYAKLANIAVESQGDGVRIRLTPKPGATIVVAELERCLDHTAAQLSKKPGL
jgi:hypothetical protein